MAESSGQESTDQNKSELKGGLYIKKGKPVSAEKILPNKLDEVSKRTGIDFVFDADKGTFTPERFVVVPKKDKL